MLKHQIIDIIDITRYNYSQIIYHIRFFVYQLNSIRQYRLMDEVKKGSPFGDGT